MSTDTPLRGSQRTASARRWERWGSAAAVGMATVLVTAGCGGSQDTATNSTPSAAATTAPVTASPSPTRVVPKPSGPAPTEMVKPTGVLTPEQEAVLVAYQAWWQKCLPAADKDPDHAVEHLRECATQEQADVRGQAIRKMQTKGFIGFGAPILHPQAPLLEKPDFAIIHDCQDNRNFGETLAASGKIHALGPEHFSYESSLIKENGVWKVAGGNEPENGNMEEYCSA